LEETEIEIRVHCRMGVVISSYCDTSDGTDMEDEKEKEREKDKGGKEMGEASPQVEKKTKSIKEKGKML
jgi:hypothetical protein